MCARNKKRFFEQSMSQTAKCLLKKEVKVGLCGGLVLGDVKIHVTKSLQVKK